MRPTGSPARSTKPVTTSPRWSSRGFSEGTPTSGGRCRYMVSTDFPVAGLRPPATAATLVAPTDSPRPCVMSRPLSPRGCRALPRPPRIEAERPRCHNRIHGLGPVGPDGRAAQRPGGIEDEMTIAFASALAAVVGAGLLWLGTNVRVVKQYERGVVYRFGRVQA